MDNLKRLGMIFIDGIATGAGWAVGIIAVLQISGFGINL